MGQKADDGRRMTDCQNFQYPTSNDEFGKGAEVIGRLHAHFQK